MRIPLRKDVVAATNLARASPRAYTIAVRLPPLIVPAEKTGNCAFKLYLSPLDSTI